MTTNRQITYKGKPAQLIVESRAHNQFVMESMSTDDLPAGALCRLFGTYAYIGDDKNRNGRSYEFDNYFAQVQSLQPKIAAKRLLGELEHCKRRTVKYANVSHRIDSIEWNPKKQCFEGWITIFNTPAGQTAFAIVSAGSPLFISSRAIGIVNPKTSKVTILKLITFDLVAEPGFYDAEFSQQSTNAAMSINESKDMLFVNEAEDDSTETSLMMQLIELARQGILQKLFPDSIANQEQLEHLQAELVTENNQYDITMNKKQNQTLFVATYNDTSKDFDASVITAVEKILDEVGCDYTDIGVAVAYAKLTTEQQRKCNELLGLPYVDDSTIDEALNLDYLEACWGAIDKADRFDILSNADIDNADNIAELVNFADIDNSIKQAIVDALVAAGKAQADMTTIDEATVVPVNDTSFYEAYQKFGDADKAAALKALKLDDTANEKSIKEAYDNFDYNSKIEICKAFNIIKIDEAHTKAEYAECWNNATSQLRDEICREGLCDDADRERIIGLKYEDIDAKNQNLINTGMNFVCLDEAEFNASVYCNAVMSDFKTNPEGMHKVFSDAYIKSIAETVAKSWMQYENTKFKNRWDFIKSIVDSQKRIHVLTNVDAQDFVGLTDLLYLAADKMKFINEAEAFNSENWWYNASTADRQVALSAIKDFNVEVSDAANATWDMFDNESRNAITAAIKASGFVNEANGPEHKFDSVESAWDSSEDLRATILNNIDKELKDKDKLRKQTFSKLNAKEQELVSNQLINMGYINEGDEPDATAVSKECWDSMSNPEKAELLDALKLDIANIAKLYDDLSDDVKNAIVESCKDESILDSVKGFGKKVKDAFDKFTNESVEVGDSIKIKVGGLEYDAFVNAVNDVDGDLQLTVTYDSATSGIVHQIDGVWSFVDQNPGIVVESAEAWNDASVEQRKNFLLEKNYTLADAEYFAAQPFDALTENTQNFVKEFFKLIDESVQVKAFKDVKIGDAINTYDAGKGKVVAIGIGKKEFEDALAKYNIVEDTHIENVRKLIVEANPSTEFVVAKVDNGYDINVYALHGSYVNESEEEKLGNFNHKLHIGDKVMTRFAWQQGQQTSDATGSITAWAKDSYNNDAAEIKLDNGKMTIQPLSNIWLATNVNESIIADKLYMSFNKEQQALIDNVFVISIANDVKTKSNPSTDSIGAICTSIIDALIASQTDIDKVKLIESNRELLTQYIAAWLQDDMINESVIKYLPKRKAKFVNEGDDSKITAEDVESIIDGLVDDNILTRTKADELLDAVSDSEKLTDISNKADLATLVASVADDLGYDVEVDDCLAYVNESEDDNVRDILLKDKSFDDFELQTIERNGEIVSVVMTKDGQLTGIEVSGEMTEAASTSLASMLKQYLATINTDESLADIRKRLKAISLDESKLAKLYTNAGVAVIDESLIQPNEPLWKTAMPHAFKLIVESLTPAQMSLLETQASVRTFVNENDVASFYRTRNWQQIKQYVAAGTPGFINEGLNSIKVSAAGLTPEQQAIVDSIRG